MKFDIQVKEINKRGAANVVVEGKQWLLGWEKLAWDISGENRKRKEVVLNALKARTIVELIKAKNEIEAGAYTDNLVVNNSAYMQDWLELNQQLVFDIKND